MTNSSKCTEISETEQFAKDLTSSFALAKPERHTPEFLTEAQGHITKQNQEWKQKNLKQKLEFINNNLDFVVMGLPGGGTTFVANLLSACKTKTGHEAVFHQSNTLKYDQIWAAGIKGDCSGFLYPWRKLLTTPTVYTIVRDPLDTINSLVQRHNKTFEEACQLVTQVYQHRPNTFRLQNIIDFVQIITHWPRPSIIRQIDLLGKGGRNYHGTLRKITHDDLPKAVQDLREYWDYD